jgi:flavin-dependent thymidylate synthase
MQVTLLDYTGKHHSDAADYAASLLIFTKNTRLEMQPNLFEEIQSWPQEKKFEELTYMANTIPSSWEFVHYTFLITGVTRAFTHQFVRTRTASYAQQTMRVLNVKGWDYGTGPTIDDSPERSERYKKAMDDIAVAYDDLIKMGAKIEDARGVLPTNITTNIVMSCSMRTFVEMVRKRSSPRTQGEYRDVLEAMQKSVADVHYWISLFTERTFDVSAKDLDKEIADIQDDQKRIRMMKLVDQMRTGK